MSANVNLICLKNFSVFDILFYENLTTFFIFPIYTDPSLSLYLTQYNIYNEKNRRGHSQFFLNIVRNIIQQDVCLRVYGWNS